MTDEQKDLLDYAYNYPAAFGRKLGYLDLTDALHGEWMKKILSGETDLTIQSHRGSYKTTCICICLAVLMVTRPELTIMFLRKTEGDVSEVINQVGKILHNEFFVGWYNALMGKPYRILVQNQLSITVDCYAAPRGADQLLGIGSTGSLTGKHADMVFTDDIINVKDRVSAAERNRTKLVYQELQNVRNRGGRIINTGTPWHPDDAFSIMPPAEKWDCYTTGLIERAKLDEIRASMVPSLFAANYELRHIAAEDALFDSEIAWENDWGFIQDGVAHIDASYGGEDFTAFTIGHRDGDRLYMYGKLYRGHVNNHLNEILADCDRFFVKKIYCETNGDKGYLGRDIREMGYTVSLYPERMNKYQKISSFLYKWWKQIVWMKGTDDAYLDQIIGYTRDAEHDDAPDSAACICRILNRNNSGLVIH